MPAFKSLRWLPEAESYADEWGLDQNDVESIVRSATQGTLDPRSNDAGYLIVRYRAGDVIVVVGYRETDHPMILSVYLHIPGNETIGGKKSAGSGAGSTLPRSYLELRKRIMAAGYKITADLHPKVYDPQDGTVFYTLPGTASDHRSLANNWRAWLKAKVKYESQNNRTKD